jgi:hypothetical protein
LLQVTGEHQFTNQAIRQEINVFNILEKTAEYRTNWFHHTERVDESKFAKTFHQVGEEVDHTNDKTDQFSELNLGAGTVY